MVHVSKDEDLTYASQEHEDNLLHGHSYTIKSRIQLHPYTPWLFKCDDSWCLEVLNTLVPGSGTVGARLGCMAQMEEVSP